MSIPLIVYLLWHRCERAGYLPMTRQDAFVRAQYYLQDAPVDIMCHVLMLFRLAASRQLLFLAIAKPWPAPLVTDHYSNIHVSALPDR
jgi:hypothetical protein